MALLARHLTASSNSGGWLRVSQKSEFKIRTSARAWQSPYLLTNNTSTSRRLAGRRDTCNQVQLLELFENGDLDTIEVPLDKVKIERREGRQMLLVDPLTKTLAVVSLNFLEDIFGSSSLACNMLDKAMNVSECVPLIVTATTEGSSHHLFCKQLTGDGHDPAWTVSLEVAITDATKVIFRVE